MKSVPPSCHQRLGEVGHAQERPDRDVHRGLAKPSRGHVGDAAAEGVLGREGDRVDEEVEPAPVGGDAVEDRFELAVRHHVHRQEDRRLDLARERLDVRLGLVVEVGDRELGAEGAEGAGAAPGDRLVVGDADDQALLAVEQLRLHVGQGHAGLPIRARVWRAIISSSSVGTTRRATRLAGVEMRSAPAALAAGSSSAPSQASRSAMRARIAGGVLADAGGEDEGVEAAEGGGELAGVQARSGRRNGRWRSAAPGSSLASRSRMSLETPERPFRPELVVEEPGDLGGGHALRLDQVQDDAGVELAGAGAHRQAVEGGEAHRALDAAAVAASRTSRRRCRGGRR